MAESTQVLDALKRAANYSKLAFHKDGPQSYKKGQGALTKVLVKFGDAGTMSIDALAKALGWDEKQTAEVILKAQENGYVLAESVDGAPSAATITDKGREVVEKRFGAEDRVADEVLQQLSDVEKEQLLALCGKVIDQCEAMGVDYSLIKKRPEKSCKKAAKKTKKAKGKKKDKDAKKSRKATKKADKKHRRAYKSK